MGQKVNKKVNFGLSKKSEERSVENSEDTAKDEVISTTPQPGDVQFRIMVGSYEHNLLCVSVVLKESGAVFQPIFHFQAHSLSIKSMDIAKRYLVTGSNDEHIRIYDLQKRKELGTLLSHQGTITTLRFSNEGTTDTQTDVGSTEKSGKWLLSGSEDGKIIIWRTKDWEQFGTLKGHEGRVSDIAIHPSGRVALSVSQDHTIRLWNLMTAKKAAILKVKGRDHLGQTIEFVRWSQNGDNFVVGLTSQLFVYKTSTAKITRKIKLKLSMMCMEILNIEDKEWLVLGFNDGSISFYDLNVVVLLTVDDAEQTTEELEAHSITSAFTLRGHTNRVKDLTFIQHPVETKGLPYLVSVSSDGKVIVWDMTSSVRDQVAVYDTGERLNCVAATFESVEKANTMKRAIEEAPSSDESDSSIQDQVRSSKISAKNKKKSKKERRSKVQITFE